MVRRRAIRPSLFKDNKTVTNKMQQIGNRLIKGTLDAGSDAIEQIKPKNVIVKRKPKYLEVTENRMNKLGVIDLKPYFARSSKRRIRKDGGWYLRVPIRIKSREMSRRMYEELRAINISPNNKKTVISNYLYDRRRDSEATWLNYTPKSFNIEKRKVGNNRHMYTAYRTVSDKSPVNSWIINRQRITKDNTSKTMVENVNRLMKWKMKNGWE